MRIIVAYFLLCVSATAQSIPPTPPAIGNFVYIDQIGNSNNIFIEQVDAGQKQSATILKGDLNSITILQQGLGNHTAMVNQTYNNATNNQNVLQIAQGGASNNSATIQLTDPVNNSNNNASITQSGGTGADKQFTLQLKGSGIGVTVVQDNSTTKDSSSMSITCVAPPCSGYSYIKH